MAESESESHFFNHSPESAVHHFIFWIQTSCSRHSKSILAEYWIHFGFACAFMVRTGGWCEVCKSLCPALPSFGEEATVIPTNQWVHQQFPCAKCVSLFEWSIRWVTPKQHWSGLWEGRLLRRGIHMQSFQSGLREGLQCSRYTTVFLNFQESNIRYTQSWSEMFDLTGPNALTLVQYCNPNPLHCYLATLGLEDYSFLWIQSSHKTSEAKAGHLFNSFSAAFASLPTGSSFWRTFKGCRKSWHTPGHKTPIRCRGLADKLEFDFQQVWFEFERAAVFSSMSISKRGKKYEHKSYYCCIISDYQINLPLAGTNFHSAATCFRRNIQKLPTSVSYSLLV